MGRYCKADRAALDRLSAHRSRSASGFGTADLDAPNRRIEKFDRVMDWPCAAQARRGGGHLQHAARVGGRDEVGPDRVDVAGLAVAELARRLRLDKVVDARAPAADLLFGE